MCEDRGEIKSIHKCMLCGICCKHILTDTSSYADGDRFVCSLVRERSKTLRAFGARTDAIHAFDTTV